MIQKQPCRVISLVFLCVLMTVLSLAVFVLGSQHQYVLGASQGPFEEPSPEQEVLDVALTLADAGEVQFFKKADRFFDVYTLNPDLEQQIWMCEHFWRMLTYPPYFDTRLSWYPNAWAYKDLYAIYLDDGLADEHPEWVLRDVDGHRLYIPYDCTEITCTQYAADIGNSEFRAYWIAEAANALASGYVGLWVDDVAMTWWITEPQQSIVYPIDPRTGITMTLEDWQRYFAEFVEEIDIAFGQDYEIVHNVIWYADSTDNPYIIREIDAADYINLERGVNDGELVGGSGPFGLESFLAFSDFVHDRGKSVLFLDEKTSVITREYSLAGWLLISEPGDAFSSDATSTPDDWWSGYELDIGAALGTRYAWEQLIRRNFECGTVLLNQPDNPTHTVPLDDTYITLEGKVISSSLALGTETGAILLKPCARFGDQTVYMPEFSPAQYSAHTYIGTETTYELALTNAGITTDVYTLSIGGNVWPTDLLSSVGPLSPGQGQTISAVVTIPVAVAIGAQGVATVTAISLGDPTKIATATLTTIADNPYRQPVIGSPKKIVYYFPITNTSLVSDGYHVSVDGNVWSVDYPMTVAPIPSGESGDLPVTVNLPMPGTLFPLPVSDTFTITLTSMGDPTKMTILSHTTSIKVNYTLAAASYVYLPLLLRQ